MVWNDLRETGIFAPEFLVGRRLAPANFIFTLLPRDSSALGCSVTRTLHLAILRATCMGASRQRSPMQQRRGALSRSRLPAARPFNARVAADLEIRRPLLVHTVYTCYCRFTLAAFFFLLFKAED